MYEMIKFVGGVLWQITIPSLIVALQIGFPLLMVAIVLSIWSVSKGRQRRHDELIAAGREAQQ